MLLSQKIHICNLLRAVLALGNNTGLCYKHAHWGLFALVQSAVKHGAVFAGKRVVGSPGSEEGDG